MVDETVKDAPAPVASPESSPAEVTVTPTPEISPAAEPTPSAEPAKPADAPAVEPEKKDAPVEIPAEAKKPDTLLAQEKKPEAKEGEETPEVKEGDKPAEAKPEEAPVELPKYEINLPEGVEVDESKFGEFTKMLGDFEVLSKSPHEEVQKLGQQMVERHMQEMQRYTESLTQAWNKQADDWKQSFLKDPEFVNRTDTVLNSAIDAINVYAGDDKQQQEFRELMESSKIGNHPAMIRLLSNVMTAKAVKPLAAPQIATPMKQSKISKMYGNK